MEEPYRRSARPGGGRAEPSSIGGREKLRSRLVTVAIAAATVAVAIVALGAEPVFSGCGAREAPGSAGAP